MTDRRESEWSGLKREFKRSFFIVIGSVVVMWVIQLADVACAGSLSAFGIRPREPIGLLGLLTAPWLHHGFPHLAGNTLPFIVLGWLIVARSPSLFVGLSTFTALGGGLGVWLIGATGSVHAGSSGVIFGYFGFLLFAGWFERRVGTIIVSVLTLLLYGGLIFGVLPGQPGISWESHFFGLLCGGAFAYGHARFRQGRQARSD